MAPTFPAGEGPLLTRENHAFSRLDRLRYWLFTKNSSRTGVLWLVASLLFFFAAGIIALEMRLELLAPQEIVRGPVEYGALFSVHGTFMIFFFAVPVFFGFASAILPRALGVDNLAFPRLNNLDLWLILLGGGTLELGHLLGQSPMAGWTGYPPLSLPQFQPTVGMDLWTLAVFLETLGTLLAAVNILATVLRKRQRDLSMRGLPFFAWTMVFTSLLVVVAAPFLLTALSLLYLDRNLGTAFYPVADAPGLLLWQDLFWFYSHPATYVMLLPAFGVVTAILARFLGRPLFSYRMLFIGTAGVWFFSYLLWWHHMFPTGLALGPRIFGAVNTWAVSLFSGLVVFAWIASMWRSRPRFTTPMLWALGMIATFTIGGADGVFLAYVPLDTYLHDTYWLVAHFHYIIVGSTVLGVVAGIYYWFPAVMHRRLDERLGKWHFWLTLAGVNLNFLPMHYLGMAGVVRRTWLMPPGFEVTNWIITFGAFLTALAQVIFLWNIYRTLRHGERVDDSVWGDEGLSVAGPTPGDTEPTQLGGRPEHQGVTR